MLALALILVKYWITSFVASVFPAPLSPLTLTLCFERVRSIAKYASRAVRARRQYPRASVTLDRVVPSVHTE